MNYQETLEYLFSALPMYQRVGASAFKKDLSNTKKLCDHLGNPERKFKTIHIAGTNGKGSSSHMLASIFQEAGYKTGLYTSPHLKSFTERIRINGAEIDEDSVVSFVEKNKDFLDELKPSFFEMTVALAFWFFAKQKVDIAIVEVGMGGRFDSTNVIAPEISLITNIGWDHMQFLGDTLPLIAGEKAGIIKERVPVVISQTQEETKDVFIQKAKALDSSIHFGDLIYKVSKMVEEKGRAIYRIEQNGLSQSLSLDLLGDYQESNLPGVLEVVSEMKDMGWNISDSSIEKGLSNVIRNTSLKGRWQILEHSPIVICDTAHNQAGIELVVKQINSYSFSKLWIILGMVKDKNISTILSFFPKEATFIFCQADLPRALPAKELAELGNIEGIKSEVIPNVNDAIAFAKRNAGKNDLIFVGGSTFVVAEIENL